MTATTQETTTCKHCGKIIPKFGPGVCGQRGRQFCPGGTPHNGCASDFYQQIKNQRAKEKRRKNNGENKLPKKRSSSDNHVQSENDCLGCDWYKKTWRWNFKNCLDGCVGGPIVISDRTKATNKLTNLGVQHFSLPEVMIATEVGLPKPQAGRVDLFSINREGDIRIAEVKSCRDDFTQDKKWQDYLEYCDYFYFIIPTYEVYPDEIPDGIGLLQPFLPEKEDRFTWKTREEKHQDPTKWTTLRIVKRPKRLFQIEMYTRFYMLRKLAFFNNKKIVTNCPKCNAYTSIVKSYTNSPTLKFILLEKNGLWAFEMWNIELNIRIKPQLRYPTKEKAREQALLICDKLGSEAEEIL